MDNDAGPGGRAFQEAIQHWNQRRFDDAFARMGEALHEGLTPTHACHAHATRGHVLIDRGDLHAAVQEYLSCLAIQKRSATSTWESAIRLAIIYGEAGRDSEADALEQLADKANARGLELEAEYEDKLCSLVRGTPSASVLPGGPDDVMPTESDTDDPNRRRQTEPSRAHPELWALNIKTAVALPVDAFPQRCCVCLGPAETVHNVSRMVMEGDPNNLSADVPVCQACATSGALNPTAWPLLLLVAFVAFGFAALVVAVGLGVPDRIGEILIGVYVVGIVILGGVALLWFASRGPRAIELDAGRSGRMNFIADIRFRNPAYQKLFDEAKAAAVQTTITSLQKQREQSGTLDFGDALALSVELERLEQHFAELPRQFARDAIVVGGSAHRVIATVAGVCDDAARALTTGLDVNGQPILEEQIAVGLRRLVADARHDTGLVATMLTPAGVSRYTSYLDDLEALAGSRTDHSGEAVRPVPASAVKQEDMDNSTQGSSLTTGTRLTGTRNEVSNAASKAGRAGKCRDCSAVVTLATAKEACLDWDGVDAYHFYCPRCYKGTRDPHYYTGQLLGSDGKAVIDQHAWYYER